MRILVLYCFGCVLQFFIILVFGISNKTHETVCNNNSMRFYHNFVTVGFYCPL